MTDYYEVNSFGEIFFTPSDLLDFQYIWYECPVYHEFNVLKGTVSRDNLYSIFSIDHILLVLLEVLYEDLKFRRIFAVLFNQKWNSPV